MAVIKNGKNKIVLYMYLEYEIYTVHSGTQFKRHLWRQYIFIGSTYFQLCSTNKRTKVNKQKQTLFMIFINKFIHSVAGVRLTNMSGHVFLIQIRCLFTCLHIYVILMTDVWWPGAIKWWCATVCICMKSFTLNNYNLDSWSF
jgi:hypothetical protein